MPSFNWRVYSSNKWNFLWPRAVRVVIIVVKMKQEDILVDSYDLINSVAFVLLPVVGDAVAIFKPPSVVQ